MQFDGILFFPLTPFDDEDKVNETVLTEHIASGVEHGAGGVFAACGTGEIHALSAAEHATVVRRAVEVSAGRTPVVAGAGGSVGTAIEQATLAREAGADGVLLLPPYLVNAPQEGLVDYVRTVANAVDIPVVIYQRGTWSVSRTGSGTWGACTRSCSPCAACVVRTSPSSTGCRPRS